MADSSGNPNNLTNSGVTYVSTPGLLTNTATYSSSAPSTTVAANDTQTNFTGTTPFSVCGWFRQTSGSFSEADLIGNLNSASNYQGWQVYLTGASASVGAPPNAIGFILSNNVGSSSANVWYAWAPTIGTAAHFCFTTDGTEKASGMLGYINGSGISQGYVITDSLSGSTASGLNLGIGWRPSSTNNYLSGGIADVRIFNYALSSSQVAALYAAGVK
jgi:hypothetical protein